MCLTLGQATELRHSTIVVVHSYDLQSPTVFFDVQEFKGSFRSIPTNHHPQRNTGQYTAVTNTIDVNRKSCAERVPFAFEGGHRPCSHRRARLQIRTSKVLPTTTRLAALSAFPCVGDHSMQRVQVFLHVVFLE